MKNRPFDLLLGKTPIYKCCKVEKSGNLHLFIYRSECDKNSPKGRESDKNG